MVSNLRRLFITALVLLLAGCATAEYVGNPNGLLLPDGSVQITTTANAGLPLVGNPVRGLFVWRHDPKINKTEFVWGASSSGQLTMPDLSKMPLAISVP
jgi:hypothetical protein